MAREIIRRANREHPCSRGCGHIIKPGEQYRDDRSGSGMRVCLDCKDKPRLEIELPSRLRTDVPGAAVLAERLRAGAAFKDLVAEYRFSPSGLRSRLRLAGFDYRGNPRQGDLVVEVPQIGLLVQSWVEPWMADGICAQTDPEAFFPEKGGSTADAKRVCVGCPVREACLQYALEHEEKFGVWGGKSERERRKLAKQRSAA